MKPMPSKSVRRIVGVGWLCLIALSFGPPSAHARTITVSLDFGRLQYSTIDPNYQGQTYYTVNVSVSSDIPPVTYDEVISPIPAYSATETGSSRTFFNDISSAMNPMTNGVWTLTVNKGDVSEKQYTFTVSSGGLDNTNLPAVQITTPADGSPAVSTNTPFSWSGPASWNELFLRNHTLDYSFDAYDFPSPAATSWNTAPPMPLGTNEFEVSYWTNGAPWFTISTPVDNLSHPFTNWVGGSRLFVQAQSGFVTSTNPAAAPGTSHTLIAHYAFDDSGSIGQDSSGNGNDMSSPTTWGPVYQFDADAEAGGGAVQFFGTSALNADGQTLTNLNAVLAGSFTFSAWVKTTVTNGADDNSAFSGATIFWADNDQGNTNDTIPLSITGSKVAFTTRDHTGNNNTLHSLTSVNDGSYHLITVTRDQASGEKKIYVDGNFETSKIGTTDPLNGNNYRLTIGGWAYCADTNCTSFYAYNGLLDDVQIYSGVLSGNDVAYLYANPGSNVVDTAGSDFNTALNTTGLAWTTGGDSSWLVETTNTQDNVAAAQSGSVTDNQSSTLSVTVTGPGTLTFYWSSIAEDPNFGFDYEFDIDGVYANDIYGDNSWVQDGPYQVGSGQHTFTWTTHANGDTDPTQAGFLDQVSFANSGVPLTFSLMVIRQTYASYQPFVTGQTAFFAFPGLSGSDTPISYHRVESPNNDCSANFGPTNGGAGASILLTFDELANSLTNGNWKLWLNKDTPQEKLYTFTVNAFAFSSNSLAPVLIIVPLDGASAVATNTPYQWTGPNNWSNLTTQAWLTRSGTNFYYASANLPVTTVSWPAGPILLPGTNFFYVEYDKYNVTNFVVGSPYPEWSVGSISYQSGATAGFLVSGTTALPATLLNPKNNNTNFQFQFLSQAGYTHAVQYRTNLVKGSNWQTYSNVIGDGTLKTIPIPLSVFNPSKQGFVRVLSQ